jgi:SAM-dependent methyltransferase
MITELRSSRVQIDRDLGTAGDRKYLSPAFYGQTKAVAEVFAQHLAGEVIDLGCGVMPYADLLPQSVTSYLGIDTPHGVGQPHLFGDVQNLSMLSDACCDAVVCLEVLEHIPEPQKAVAEIARILRPGGTVILSVPHLSRLHEIPYDYYRYTEYGIEHLLRQVGLEPFDVAIRGGLFAFLGHQVSTVVLALVWRWPKLRGLAQFINKWLVTLPCFALDQIGGQRRLFPLGYVVAARKVATGTEKAQPQ